jgi:hypothetical protein
MCEAPEFCVCVPGGGGDLEVPAVLLALLAQCLCAGERRMQEFRRMRVHQVASNPGH